MRTTKLTVRVQLPVGWNTYLLSNSDIVNFVWKTDYGEAESIVLLISALWRCFNHRWMRGENSYLGPAGIASFSSWDFSRSNKHDRFWYVVSTWYFYGLFLWARAVSDFRCLEIYKNLGLGFPLSAITFTINRRAGNHFYKYIYFFQILYYMILYFCIFKFDLNAKHRFYFF